MSISSLEKGGGQCQSFFMRQCQFPGTSVDLHTSRSSYTLCLCPFVCVRVCMSVNVCVSMYVCAFVYVCVWMSACPSVCVFLTIMSCISVCLSVCLSVCVSFCLSVWGYWDSSYIKLMLFGVWFSLVFCLSVSLCPIMSSEFLCNFLFMNLFLSVANDLVYRSSGCLSSCLVFS